MPPYFSPQIVFWPTAIFIVARGNAPGIENGTNRFGQRPYSNQSTRIEYGRWPKKLRVFRIPGALPQAVLKEAVGHKSKQRNFKTGASGVWSVNQPLSPLGT